MSTLTVTSTAPVTTEPTAAPIAAPAAPARKNRAHTLVRNATALMTSTLTSGVLTFGFWVVAARWFPADVVGIVAAVAASMALLGSLAQLNLINLFARFLPLAGDRTRRLVLSGYAASTATAAVLIGGYALLSWSHRLVGDDPAIWLLFAGMVLASPIFFLQDSVLTALGRAGWVPVIYGVVGVARLALLPLFDSVAADATGAVLAAWTLPVVVATLAVTWWVLARGAPAHGRGQPAATPAGRRGLLGFAAAEYVNGLFTNATAFLPPLLIASAFGAADSAYFYLPWVIGTAAVTLLWNVVTSFVVAASRDGTRARAHLNQLIGLMAAVVVPGALVLSLAAGPLMSVLGADYAANSATTLRLIGLSLPFAGIVLIYSAFSVMEQRIWGLVATRAGGAVVLFAGGWIGLSQLGITSFAAALLASQVVVAAALLPALIRKYRETGAPHRAPQWAMESA
jgi:O-antigen/teichoic acid export membrane protein